MFLGSGMFGATVKHENSGSAAWRECKDNRGLPHLFLLTEWKGNLGYVPLDFMTGFTSGWDRRSHGKQGLLPSNRTQRLWQFGLSDTLTVVQE